MIRAIRLIASIAFIYALTKLLRLDAPNAYWWIMVTSFYCISEFTED